MYGIKIYIYDIYINIYNIVYIYHISRYDIYHISQIIYIYIYIFIYIDDGLAVVKNANGHTLDKLRKKTITIFKVENLSMHIEANLIETEFLDNFQPPHWQIFSLL